MSTARHPLRTQGISTLDIIAYIVVFFCFNGMLGWLFLETLPIKTELDWLLIALYGLLSMASYYYFVVNDLLAARLKGRSMALGFLFAHGAFAFIGYAQIFRLPVDMVWYLSGILLLSAYIFGGYGATRFTRYNRETRELMRVTSETDELTGLFNRRHYSRYSQQLVDSSHRNSQPLSVLMFDLDDFKQVNDELGHAAGDVVLIEISRIMSQNLRKADHAYRWGGEEFLVLLPQTSLADAVLVANKIIKQVAESTFYYHPHEIKLTISAGVAECNHEACILQNIIKRADQALYLAKQQGKNQVVDEGELKDESAAETNQSINKYT